MQLLHSAASPFARKVRATAIEAGLADRIELVEVATTPVATAEPVARANPVGKIPVLLRGEGPALYDSRVICRYLDAQAGARLYPESRIWEELTLEATADGLMDAAVAIVYDRRFREAAQQHEGMLSGQRDRITRALDALEARWMAHLSGRISAGQIAVGCARGYLDFRLDELSWREGRTQLAVWYARFAERPAMRETAPPAA